MIISLANETTASGFYFDVPVELYDIIANQTEDERSIVFANKDFDFLSGDEAECELHYNTLRTIASNNGINPDLVQKFEMHTLWFDTGW